MTDYHKECDGRLPIAFFVLKTLRLFLVLDAEREPDFWRKVLLYWGFLQRKEEETGILVYKKQRNKRPYFYKENISYKFKQFLILSV